jgi:competence protein ComGC
MAERGKGGTSSQSEGAQILGLFAFVLIIIFYVLLALYVRGTPTGKALGRKKNCQSNLRVIIGAHEMFRMENDAQLASFSIKDLAGGGYIKSMPNCYGDRGEVGTGTYEIEDGIWKCTFHGTIDDIEKEIQDYKSLSQVLQRGVRRFDLGALIFIPLFVD